MATEVNKAVEIVCYSMRVEVADTIIVQNLRVHDAAVQTL